MPVFVFVCALVKTNMTKHLDSLSNQSFVVRPSLAKMTTTSSNHWMLWVRRWLMSPILALKVRLQNGQANAGAEFVRDAVPSLLLRCWRFCCCSAMRLVSYPDTPDLTKVRQAERSCARSSQESGLMLQHFKDAIL